MSLHWIVIQVFGGRIDSGSWSVRLRTCFDRRILQRSITACLSGMIYFQHYFYQWKLNKPFRCQDMKIFFKITYEQICAKHHTFVYKEQTKFKLVHAQRRYDLQKWIQQPKYKIRINWYQLILKQIGQSHAKCLAHTSNIFQLLNHKSRSIIIKTVSDR